MSTQYKSVKLIASVYARLMLAKGNDTLSDYLEKMLTFFDVSGARPGDFQTHPSLQLKKDIDRSIAVLKAIEKDRLVPIHAAVKLMLESINAGPVIASKHSNEDMPSIEDIEALVIRNKELAEQLHITKEKVANLEVDNRKLKEKPVLGSVDVSRAKSLVDFLESRFTKPKFSSEEYLVKKETWQQFRSSLEETFRFE